MDVFLGKWWEICG